MTATLPVIAQPWPAAPGSTHAGPSHTRGPWRAIAWNCHAPTTIVAGTGEKQIVIAECSGYGRAVTDLLADAQLIAAAPELLAAAKRALRVLQAQGESTQPGNVLGALSSAITKATLPTDEAQA